MQTIPSFSGQWRRADSWPNKSELLINTGLRSSMEQLHNHPRESGMKEATHDDAFESPDLVKFSAAMRELTFQQAPPHQDGTPVAIPKPFVTSEAIIQQAAQLLAGLGQAERLRTRCNICSTAGRGRGPPRH